MPCLIPHATQHDGRLWEERKATRGVGVWLYLHGTATVVTLMIMGHMIGSVGGMHLISGQIAGEQNTHGRLARCCYATF
jgi:hypothetical protein